LEFFIRSSSTTARTTARIFGVVPDGGMRLAIADLQFLPISGLAKIRIAAL